MNQFKESLNRFKSALTRLEYNTYWEWMLIPDELKAAALYVQFYDTITLAWSKTRKPFIEEDIAVSTVLQYLVKNVDIIKKNRSRFTSNYIYKVTFNALYPLGRIQRDIDFFYNEHASTAEMLHNKNCDWADELDPDNVFYTESVFIEKMITTDSYSEDSSVEEIWEIIESCDDDTKRVIEFLVGGKKLGKKLTAKIPTVIAELRIRLEKYNI